MDAHERKNSTLRKLATKSIWLDLRSLALFRIGLGLVLLSSFLGILLDFPLLFTDEGVFPRELAVSQASNSSKWTFWSIHFASGAALWAYSLYSATIVAIIFFTLGLYTRWVTPVLYLLVLSHMGRNSTVVYGFDRISLAILFWSIFLPLDRYFSARPRRETSAEVAEPYRISSVASAAFILQIMMIYLHAGFAKYGHEWLEGTALRTSLHNDVLATHFGRWVRDHFWVSVALNYATLIIEVLAPILLVLPTKTAMWRFLGCILLFLLHFGIALTMDLAWFPYACGVMVLAPMPFEFFSFCVSIVRRTVPGPILKTLGMPVRLLTRATKYVGTVVVNNQGRIARGASAIILTGALLASLIFFTAIMFRSAHQLPRWFYDFVVSWGLGQEWSFFGPNPRNTDARYIIKGTFSDGSVYDITWGKKEPLQFDDSLFHAGNGSKLRANQWQEDIFRGEGVYARKLCSNLCIKFTANSIAGEPGLSKIDVYALTIKAEQDGKRLAPKPNLIWYWNCGG